MQATVTKELTINDLPDQTTAQAIESTIEKIAGVKKATVDLSKKTLCIELTTDGKSILKNVVNVISKAHPEISFASKNNSVYLNGLGCANCAAKILDQVQQLDYVQEAKLDFVSQKLTFNLYDDKDYAQSLAGINKIVAALEPGVKVSQNKPAAGGHEHDHGDRSLFYNIILVIGGLIFLAAMMLDFPRQWETGLFLFAYLLVGYDVLWRAVKNISHGEIFDENFLMSIATVGAITIGEYPEAVAVMLFYQIGEYFQHKAVDSARGSISALMDIRPDFANLKTADGLQQVSPESVKVGDIIVIKPGEKIPLDGSVLEGISALDTMALTGESMPYDVQSGSPVLSGSINKTGLLTVQVSKEFGESTVAKILDLVENAASQKAPTEKFITKFARYYTPFVVFAAALLATVPPLVLADTDFSTWINRALVFLVVSCPCALVVSVPLSFFSGIGAASKKGILIKGSNYLEALNNVDTIVFDKTGTLTKGIFSVNNIVAAPEIEKDELLFYAAHAENASNHPIARSILTAYAKKPQASLVTGQQELAGLGIKAKINGHEILAGNSKLMQQQNIAYTEAESTGTIVYVAKDSMFLGYLEITDQLKADSAQAIQKLKALGIKETIMLTGDNKATGEKIAQQLNIDKVYTQLLPQDKVQIFDKLHHEKKTKGNMVFVGDGINDAPVLARADVGIAMGAIGSDAAIEAADIVIMTDEPAKIVSAINIAKKTRSIVMQNIIFALGVKAVVMLLGAIGLASMWAAVFSDVGVALIAVINSMRALRI